MNRPLSRRALAAAKVALIVALIGFGCLLALAPISIGRPVATLLVGPR